MRFATAEVGLELYDGVTALTGDALDRAYQEKLEALGEVRPAEELGRILVFVRPFAQIHLPQIGGELGLLITAAGHVLVRRHHFAPGLEVGRTRAFDDRAGALALFGSHLLIEAQAQKLHLHFLDLIRLGGGYGGQEPPRRIERTVGVVAGE
jgi:hypothetical protein